ncbi:MAG: peptidase S8 [Armatimonadetes bacterium]|nr:peptidase S8 [Armatimonadota bacterium]
MKRWGLFLIGVGCLGLVGVSKAQSTEQTESAQQVIVRYKSGTRDFGSVVAATAIGARIVGALDKTKAQIIAVPFTMNAERVAAYYRSLPDVLYAEPDYAVELLDSPGVSVSDPDESQQQHLSQIHAPQAWQTTFGSPSVRVAVVDTGVDLSHPDLIDNITQGRNIADPSTEPTDAMGHGTHCAGIIAAKVGNATGGAGVAGNVRIMPVRVFDSEDKAYVSRVAEGIYWATDNGANIISISLGGVSASNTLEDAVNYAYQHNVLVVAAAGNDGSTSPSYPAAFEHVVSVAACDQNDQRASFSNYGSWVSCAAPGTNILSTWPGNRYVRASGTSMAAPVVSGIAALAWSAMPGATVDQIRSRILDTAVSVNGYVASGRADAFAAVTGGAAPTFTLSFDESPSALAGNSYVKLSGKVGGQLPNSGMTLHLTSSSSKALRIPSQIKLKANQSTFSFYAHTMPVSADASVSVKIEASGISAEKDFTVQGPALRAVRVNRSTARGGTRILLYVYLTGRSDAEVPVEITSNPSGMAQVLGNAAIPKGRVLMAFPVVLNQVASATSVDLQVKVGASAITKTVLILP